MAFIRIACGLISINLFIKKGLRAHLEALLEYLSYHHPSLIHYCTYRIELTYPASVSRGLNPEGKGKGERGKGKGERGKGKGERGKGKGERGKEE
jgi:hypothetical protein